MGHPPSAPAPGAPAALRLAPFARLAAWVERLPPFWLAFLSLSLFTLPVSSLALPIATAKVPLPLTVMGLLAVCGLNVLTLTCVAEACIRTSRVRGGTAFFGQLVSHYLGPPGTLLLSLPLLLQCILVLLANTLGLSITLGRLTGTPPPLWVAVLAPLILVRLWRESRTFGVASVLLIGGTNAALLLLLGLAALGHFRPEQLGEGRAVSGPNGLIAVFATFTGVLFALYNSHPYVCQSAKRTLNQDPSGRALVHGSICGVLCSAVLFTLWIVAVSGAVPAGELAGQRGTVLESLARVIGVVGVVGGMLLVCLLPGQGSLRVSGLFFNLLHERLPARPALLPHLLTREPVRFALCAAPVVAVLAVAEWLLLTGQGSFSKLVNFYGVLVFPVNGGVIPVLLLVASRRRGDVKPGWYWAFLGHPLLLGALYLFYFGVVVVHGLVVWQGKPFQQGAALATAALIAGCTAAIVRRGYLTAGGASGPGAVSQ